MTTGAEGPEAGPGGPPGVDELVFEFLDRLEAEGLGVLDELCLRFPEHDDVLRERVRVLRSSGLLGLAGEGEPKVPECLGDFRLGKLLGGGGMGVVYEAEQVSLGRTVALKLIRPEQLYFPGRRERFRREVSAAARLSHAGIAAVHTVGEESGLPFFAMELIVGCSLADVVRSLEGRDAASLTGADFHGAIASAVSSAEPDAREPGPVFEGRWTQTCLRVVRQVAEALEHAHGRGVLHRDVKPSNVMITPDGRAALVDFGLASREGSLRVTRTGSQLGSAAYMPPEQIDGEEFGVRSDVYSLGVSLYELLTLSLPFSSKSSDDVQRLIREGRPVAPSLRNSDIGPDAETVCLAAMEPDPDRRYLSAGAFARDLSNVLEHRPIEARRAGWALHAARWVQRKPAAATALVLGALLLVVGPIVFGIQQRQARRRIEAASTEVARANSSLLAETGRAEDNLERGLEAIETMLERVAVEHLDDVPGMQEARRDLLLDAVRLYGELLQQRSGEARLRDALARTWSALGVAHAELGDDALALEAYSAGLAISREQLAERPSDLGSLLETVGLENQLANVHMRVGEPERAVALYAAAREHMRGAEAEHGRDARFLTELAVLLRNRAVFELGAGRVDREEAEATFLEAIDVAELLCDLHGPAPSNVNALAMALWAPTSALYAGDFLHSIELLERALVLQQGAVRGAPGDPDQLQDLGLIHQNLAAALTAAGRIEEARECSRAGAERLESVAESFPEFPELVHILTDLQSLVAQSTSMLGQLEEGTLLMRAIVERKRALLAAHPEVLEYAFKLALALNNLAVNSSFEGDMEAFRAHSLEAEQFVRRALAGAGDDVRYLRLLYQTQFNQVEGLLQQERHAAAAELLDRIRGERPDDALGNKNLGEGYARCATLEAEDGELGAEVRDALVEEHMRLGLEYLWRGVELGYSDLQFLRHAPELEILRGLPAFDDLLVACEAQRP